MNSTIEKGLEEVWEKADVVAKKNLCSPRSLLVKGGDDPWGKPIEEIVNIVVDDIQGMPWSRDERWEVSMSFDEYFKELRKQARKKFFDHYEPYRED